MPLTDMLDMLGLGKLFKKAEAGDQEAKRVVMSLNQMPSVTGQAFATPGKAEMPGLATGIVEDIPLGRSGGSMAAMPSSQQNFAEAGGGGVETQDPNKPNKWKQASILASDIARGMQDPRFRTTGGLADKFRNEQTEALKRRHAAWDNTYEISQSLPQEVLMDPKFSALAQAKAAFDKDMMDGKIDNEKSVSGFLTALAMHKGDIEQAALQRKIQDQVQMEGGLQAGREKAGLVEPKDYNFEGVTGLTGTQYISLDQQRKKDAAAAAERAIDNKRLQAQLNSLEQARKATDQDRDLGRQRLERGTTLKGVQELIESDVKRGLQPDPMNPGKLEQPTEKHLLQAVMQNRDAILEAGQKMGLQMQEPNYVTKTPGVYTIQGKTFTKDEEPSMLMFIYRMMHTQG